MRGWIVGYWILLHYRAEQARVLMKIIQPSFYSELIGTSGLGGL